jgi:hypothetical protein
MGDMPGQYGQRGRELVESSDPSVSIEPQSEEWGENEVTGILARREDGQGPHGSMKWRCDE